MTIATAVLHVTKKDSGNKNTILLYTFQIVFTLDFTWPEFQVLTSQPDIQEIPFHDPSLYLHLYIIVPTGDSALLEWFLLSPSYVRVISIFVAQKALFLRFSIYPQFLWFLQIKEKYTFLLSPMISITNDAHQNFVMWLKAQILTWCEARLHHLLVRCLWEGVISFSKYSFLICKI